MADRKNREILSLNGSTRARVTWTEQNGTFPLTVTAKALDADGKRVSGISPVRRKVCSQEELDIKIEEAAAAVLKKIKPRKQAAEQKTNNGGLDEDSPWVIAFRTAKRKNVFIWKWGLSTIERYLSYFERNILPVIQHVEIEDEFTEEDRVALLNMLFNKCIQNGRSHKNLDNAIAVADEWLYVGQVIIDELRNIDSSLPYIFLHDNTPRKTRRQREQTKALPIEVHIAVRAECERLLPVDPRMARALMILEAGGPRTAEAAAVNASDTRDFGKYNLIVSIGFQETKGERSPILKTDNAYRKIVIDEYASDFIKRANLLIGEGSKTSAPVSSDKLRNTVKKILLQNGCNEEYFKAAQKTLSRYPTFDKEGNPENDVVAYCLRRSRQNIWSNICGLTRSEQDYLLGHKPPRNQKKFYDKDPKAFEAVVKKLKRCKLIVGPDPNVDVIEIDDDSEVSVAERSTMICNTGEESVLVWLSMDANEPGDIITITTDGNIDHVETIPSTFDQGKRRNTEII